MFCLKKPFESRNLFSKERNMAQKNDNKQTSENSKNKDKEKVINARKQADRDISKDADLSIHSPNDDLDEEESRKLNADKNDIV